MSRDDLHFRLRIPEDLKVRVEAAAGQNHRSMTAEIIARLEASFQPPDYGPVTAAILAKEHEAQMAEMKNLMADLRALLQGKE